MKNEKLTHLHNGVLFRAGDIVDCDSKVIPSALILYFAQTVTNEWIAMAWNPRLGTFILDFKFILRRKGNLRGKNLLIGKPIPL